MILGGRVGNSGTADRLLGTSILGGAALLDPTATGIAAGTAGLAYGARPVTKYLVGGYGLQDPVAEALRQGITPALSLGGQAETRRRRKQAALQRE